MTWKFLLVTLLWGCSDVFGQDIERSGFCYTQYVHVSVVKQVPSYSKHCTKVDDIKCKTTYKTSFTTKMETQCTPTFDTSCSTVLQTAYKQDCKTISDVECRIVNIDKHGKYTPKKICTDVPTQKCVPIPVKVEAEKCVNIPTQSCENVPVVASVPVPSKQCFRKPRKVCQTLVSTKPKVVIERIPKTVCPHDQPLNSQKSPQLKSHPKPSLVKSPKSKSPGKTKSHNHPHRIDEEDFFQSVRNYPSPPSEIFHDNQKSGSLNVEKEIVPEFDEYQEYLEAKQIPQNEEYSFEKYPKVSYKKEDIPLYEDPSNFLSQAQDYRQDLGDDVGEDVEPEDDYDYNDYKLNAQSHADILHQYFKHFNHNLNNQRPNYYDSLERKDRKNTDNSPANLFSGDIGDDSELIKRDLATQQEPSSSEMKATVTPL